MRPVVAGFQRRIRKNDAAYVTVALKSGNHHSP
jgi:hypothetical protein